METTILFAPLVGAILCGFGWRLVGELAAQWIATLMLCLSAMLSWVIFVTFDGAVDNVQILRWIESGTLSTDWAIRMDGLTIITMTLITTVSALIHIYSFGYVADESQYAKGDSYRPRLFAYLSLLTFAMLMFVASDNLVQLVFGWIGIGFATFLLIGFNVKKPSANAAAISAFVVNRIGDASLILGIAALYLLSDGVQLDDIFAAAPQLAETNTTFLWREWTAANLIGSLFLIAAMTKSAQILLHSWLPDAVAAPTTGGALIFAATTLTSGFFLICRMSPLFEYAQATQQIMILVGAVTAIFGASVALVQTNIKRVVAFAACSQFGFVFVAAGVGAYAAGFLHVMTLGLGLSVLYLGAGLVIQAMRHDQDMRHYGGLRQAMPQVFWLMLIGVLSITGVGIPVLGIGLAGFVSQAVIFQSTFAAGATNAYWILLAAAFLTAIYSWRLMFLIFFGSPKGDRETYEKVKDGSSAMRAPIAILAFGAICSGVILHGAFVGSEEKSRALFASAEAGAAIYLHPNNQILTEAENVPTWVKFSPSAAMVLGFLIALLLHGRGSTAPAVSAKRVSTAQNVLLKRWYIDDLYDLVFVRSSKALGDFLWRRGDIALLDGAINWIAMGFVPLLARLAGRAQAGNIFTYAFVMMIGVAVILIWFSFRGGLS